MREERKAENETVKEVEIEGDTESEGRRGRQRMRQGRRWR